MQTKTSCAQRLREAMHLRGLRQVELCLKTGIGKSAMSQYVNGSAEPKQERIAQLARTLQVTEAWLLGYDVPMEPAESAPARSALGQHVLLLDTLERRPVLREFVERLMRMEDRTIQSLAHLLDACAKEKFL